MCAFQESVMPMTYTQDAHCRTPSAEPMCQIAASMKSPYASASASAIFTTKPLCMPTGVGSCSMNAPKMSSHHNSLVGAAGAGCIGAVIAQCTHNQLLSGSDKRLHWTADTDLHKHCGLAHKHRLCSRLLICIYKAQHERHYINLLLATSCCT
jgi:hypothetical protein